LKGEKIAFSGKEAVVTKIDAPKEIIRAWGLNPEEILTRDAMREPHRTIIDRSEMENHQLNQLTSALRQQMLKEIRENQPEKSINSCSARSSPGEIRTRVGESKARYVLEDTATLELSFATYSISKKQKRNLA